MAIVATGMLVAAEGAAAAKTKASTYPTNCARMLCSFPLPTVWNADVKYEGITCTLPGVTCPSVTSGRFSAFGSFAPGIRFSGVASAAGAVTHTWTTPNLVNRPEQNIIFVYKGADGSRPDALTFTIDRSVANNSLIDIGNTATMSVFLDDLDTGTSLSLVNARPVTVSSGFATDPVIDVDPRELKIGHTYAARVATRFSFTVGAVPDLTILYRNFNLRATAEDTDEDGVADNEDNCVDQANPSQKDGDGDGKGDDCDRTPAGDADDDDVGDGEDNCVNESNPNQRDTDGDGKGDACDNTPTGDVDDDGVDNADDNCVDESNPAQKDTDGDGVGDECDATPTGDKDDDGVDNKDDNCASRSNPEQTDSDGDGKGDACDSTPTGDEDGDGVDNADDNCVNTANPGQEDGDRDDAGDACDLTPTGDKDDDGVDAADDNCPGHANPSQADSDGDGKGDACDWAGAGDGAGGDGGGDRR